MIRVTSPRLRRVVGEGEAPADKPVPKPVPKTAAKKSTTPPEPTAQPVAAATPASTSRGLGLGAKFALIGGGVLALIAMVVVVILVVVLIVVPLVAPATGVDGSAGVELVTDIAGEPEISWTHDIAGDDYQAVDVGGDRALIMPIFSSSESDSGTAPSLTLLNLNNGDEVWSVDLNKAIEGTDPGSLFVMTDIPGTETFLVNAKTTRGDRSHYVLAALNKNDGSVISTTESDVSPEYVPYKGDVLVGIYDPQNDDFTVSRYTVPELGESSVWEVVSQNARDFYLVADLVVLLPRDTEYLNEVYRVLDGKEASWGEDRNTAYVLVAGQLLKYDFAASEVIGITDHDTASWHDTVGAELFFPMSSAKSFADLSGDLGSALLVADKTDAGFVNLQRIDPETGAALWTETWDKEFSIISGVASDSVFVYDGDALVVLDLASGEERFTIALEEGKGVVFGTSMFYLQNADELIAYSYDDPSGDEVWSLDLFHPQLISQIGSHLLLHDRLNNVLQGLSG